MPKTFLDIFLYMKRDLIKFYDPHGDYAYVSLTYKKLSLTHSLTLYVKPLFFFQVSHLLLCCVVLCVCVWGAFETSICWLILSPLDPIFSVFPAVII